jgi:hypothetical protein
MELRYKKNGLQWMPERKDKQGNWVSFKEDWVKNYDAVYKLANAIASLERTQAFYTHEMFFDNEMQVMAFLGGCQLFFSDGVKDFEIFLDNK